MARIAIIGGGISGLSACHFVRSFLPSSEVSLFEKESRYGGWIKTSQIPLTSNRSMPIECGPQGIRAGNNETTDIVSELITNLNLNDEVRAPHATNSYIYHNNTLYGKNHIVFKCLIPVMFWIPFRHLYYYMKGGHSQRYNDESIYHFSKRNFGANVTNILMSSFAAIYGGGIHHLSVQSCSPFDRFKQLEMEYGSCFVGIIAGMRKPKPEPINTLRTYRLFTFNRGLQQLVDTLTNALETDQKVTLYNNFCVDEIRYAEDKKCIQLFGNDKEFEFDHVFTAVKPHCAASFNLDSNYDLKGFNLSASLVTVNVVFKNKEFVSQIADTFQGVGVVCPTEEADEDSLVGIMHSSSSYPMVNIDPDADAVSLVFMFGGPQFDVKSMSSTEVVTLCKSKLKEIYGINVDEMNEKEIVYDSEKTDEHELFCILNEEYVNADIVFKINRCEEAISHYQVGHEDKLEELRKHLTTVYHGKVSLIGSGYDGIGINVDEMNEKEIVYDSEKTDEHELFCILNEEYVNADIVFKINRCEEAISH
eukprot:638651_1